MRQPDAQNIQEVIRLAYLKGSIDKEIALFAGGAGISAQSLATGVAEHLYASHSGGVLGSAHRVQTVRNASAKSLDKPSEAEIHEAPHGDGTHRRGKGKKSSGADSDPKVTDRAEGVRNYWESMSPLQRRREMARRLALSVENKKKSGKKGKPIPPNLVKLANGNVKVSPQSKAAREHWAAMTPEQRKAENHRRKLVADENRKKADRERKRLARQREKQAAEESVPSTTEPVNSVADPDPQLRHDYN